MVNKNVRDRRSSLVQDAKMELFKKVGCLKPKKNVFHQEFEQWFDELKSDHEGIYEFDVFSLKVQIIRFRFLITSHLNMC